MDTCEGWVPNSDFSVTRRHGDGDGQPNARQQRGQSRAIGYFNNGNGWGNGYQGGVDDGGGDTEEMCDELNTDSFVRTDPEPGDFRQLVTNTVAFSHLWRME